jgi:glucokinase
VLHGRSRIIMSKKDVQLIGVDLGGTNVRAALVHGQTLGDVVSAEVPAQGSVEQVMNRIYGLIDRLDVESVDGIGIGVPSIVDVAQGIVYDVQNIPSWKEVPVKALLETRYGKPVFVNNDANCFAVGERYFGKGQRFRSFIGMIIGTGCAGGVIVDGKLYAGVNCGAGEFGMIPYRDDIYEAYCSGQFFAREYGIGGDVLFERAGQGDPEALAAFKAFGHHLGEAVKVLLYAYDPECIILGGSIRTAYPFFHASMWEAIKTFVYARSLDRLRIEVSELRHSALLGAAALTLDAGVV